MKRIITQASISKELQSNSFEIVGSTPISATIEEDLKDETKTKDKHKAEDKQRYALVAKRNGNGLLTRISWVRLPPGALAGYCRYACIA